MRSIMIYALKSQTWNLTKLSGEIGRNTEEEGLESESQTNDMENEPDRMDVLDENRSEEGNSHGTMDLRCVVFVVEFLH